MPVKQKFYIFLLSLFVFCSCSKDTTTGLAPVTATNDKVVGASANELLASSKYSSLVIEIQYMPGYTPDPASVNNLVSFLSNYLNKPSGIRVIQSQIATSGKSSLTVADAAAIEKTNRTAFNTSTEIAMYILIADAPYSDPSVLGISYRNTSVCLFGSVIQQNSGGVGQVNRTKLYSTVMEHEAGHLLGLVNIGTPMVSNHLDATHGNHCNNQNCLMYYTAETTDLLGFLLVGNIPTLDMNCINDLRNNGGR